MHLYIQIRIISWVIQLILFKKDNKHNMKGRALIWVWHIIRFGTMIVWKQYWVNAEDLKEYLSYFMFDLSTWYNVGMCWG